MPQAESKKFTFGYTVKEDDTGSINITSLNGKVYNAANKEVTIEGNLPEKTSFGIDDGVTV